MFFKLICNVVSLRGFFSHLENVSIIIYLLSNLLETDPLQKLKRTCLEHSYGVLY